MANRAGQLAIDGIWVEPHHAGLGRLSVALIELGGLSEKNQRSETTDGGGLGIRIPQRVWGPDTLDGSALAICSGLSISAYRSIRHRSCLVCLVSSSSGWRIV